MNKTITEDFVSFEVAKVLKEKGFEGDVNGYYHIRDNGHRVCTVQEFSHSEAPHLYIPSPTHQMVMKWLRKKHIIIVISPECLNIETHCSDWGVEIWWDDNYEEMSETYLTYEDACGAAIKHVIENLN